VPPARAADLAQAGSGHYELDKSHAKVVFSINHLGFSTYYGFFPDLSGTLYLDPASPPRARSA
jgi:polyisoprenoid-binding protein YceI